MFIIFFVVNLLYFFRCVFRYVFRLPSELRSLNTRVMSISNNHETNAMAVAAISQWRIPYFNLKVKVQLHSILAHKPLRCRRLFMSCASQCMRYNQQEYHAIPFPDSVTSLPKRYNLEHIQLQQGKLLVVATWGRRFEKITCVRKCWLELLTSYNGCRIAFCLSRNMAGNSRLSWIFSLLVGLNFLFNL